MKDLWLAGALQGDSDVAAFEEFLTSSGAMDEDTPNEDTPKTPQDDASPPEEDENPDTDEDGNPIVPLETDDDADDDDDAKPKDDKDEDSEVISSISAMAEFFEVEETVLLQNMEVEGLDGQPALSVGEALESWRESERIFESRATSLEADHQALKLETQGTADKQLGRVATLTKGLIAQLNQDYSSDRMASLRMEDPDKYVSAMERKQATEQLINASIQELDTEAKTRTVQSDEDTRRVLAKQNDLLLTARPEWRDDKVREAALTKGARYLMSNKWTAEEIDGITDHRLLLLVDDAVAGASLRSGTKDKSLDALRKLGLKKPNKGLKARTRRDQENPKNRQRQEAMSRLKKSGDARDAVDLFMDVM